YYGKRWVELAAEEQRINSRMKELTKSEELAQRAQGDLMKKMRALEEAHTDAPALEEVQREYDDLLRKRQETNEKSAQLQSAIAIAEARGNAPSHRALIAADTVLDEVEALANEHRALATSVERQDADAIHRALERVGTSIKNLLERLRKFKPAQAEKPDETASARRELDNLRQEVVVLDVRIREVREQIFAASKDASRVKTSFFDLQRELQTKQEAVHQAERTLNDAYIQHTRVKTQLEALEQEIRGEAPELFEIVRCAAADEMLGVDPQALHPQMIELRRRAEMIESIEPTVHDEHKELNERYEFLTAQTRDLTKSLADLEQVMAELDRRIATQRASAFEALNREFQHFFSALFDGGKAALVQIEAKEAEDGVDDAETEEPEDALPKDMIAGIDIQASPPGKRIQTVHTLSGGERAMTSIALLCAIMTINPSPFVVLDEVDAALDESNSARFAAILQELSRKVQFIVITHNRSTMQAADALYGVTMGDDGVSHVVSMKLEEAKETVKG
ncbi:MAG: AAA family ATPase, partial [Patescibacteria group bacterium]